MEVSNKMKIRSFLTLLICMLCFTGCISAGAQTLGDVNGSGGVDIVDALLVAQYYVGLNPANFNSSVADTNCSQAIDIVDALVIAQYYVGLISQFPCASTPAPTVAPTAVPNSGVLLIGRFDTSDPAGPKFGWSATTIKANFQGTEVSVKLSSTGDNWFNVIVDGTVRTPVNVPAGTSGSTPILLASGLSSGTHTIELVRRTEAHVGDAQFLGFTFGSGTLLSPPAASARRIEMIGDSITCGYGNEGTDRYQSFTTKNENAYLAYGSVAARFLGADQITVAWSGKGVIRNYGGDTTDVMPSIYLRILPYNTTNLWDTSKWIPHVAVINLSTNDYSVGIPDRTQFTTAYSNFVKKIRAQYPQAHIYCALGPMLSGDNLTSARDYISSVVNSLKSAGDAKVHFIEFPVQLESNGYGEDWHPSIKTHDLMANQLAVQIRTDLGW
jgi:lysophospholipase L1-like esterase